MTLLRALIPIIVVFNISTSVSADPVTISSYDIQQTPISGFGFWYHTYTGIITNTGRFDSGFDIADYSGGSGTLNDKLIATDGVPLTSIGDHLFVNRNDSTGSPIVPVITLHLDGTYKISQIRIFGGEGFCNIIPGAIDGATIEIVGMAIPIPTSPFGTANCIGIQPNDRLDLSNTSLASIPTNQIILRNITATYGSSLLDQFAITEIEVDGTKALNIPTDKTQCMKAGWNKYGFKNQGQCIQFVNTGK